MLNLTSLLWLLWATWIHEKWMKIGWTVAGYGRMQSEVPSFQRVPFIDDFPMSNAHLSPFFKGKLS